MRVLQHELCDKMIRVTMAWRKEKRQKKTYPDQWSNTLVYVEAPLSPQRRKNILFTLITLPTGFNGDDFCYTITGPSIPLRNLLMSSDTSNFWGFSHRFAACFSCWVISQYFSEVSLLSMIFLLFTIIITLSQPSSTGLRLLIKHVFAEVWNLGQIMNLLPICCFCTKLYLSILNKIK